jgi:hypothetical protein
MKCDIATGVLIDDAQGNHASNEIYSDFNVHKLESLPRTQPNREVDLAIADAGEEGRLHSFRATHRDSLSPRICKDMYYSTRSRLRYRKDTPRFAWSPKPALSADPRYHQGRSRQASRRRHRKRSKHLVTRAHRRSCVFVHAYLRCCYRRLPSLHRTPWLLLRRKW